MSCKTGFGINILTGPIDDSSWTFLAIRSSRLKATFHDTDIDTDILARIFRVARVGLVGSGLRLGLGLGSWLGLAFGLFAGLSGTQAACSTFRQKCQLRFTSIQQSNTEYFYFRSIWPIMYNMLCTQVGYFHQI